MMQVHNTILLYEWMYYWKKTREKYMHLVHISNSRKPLAGQTIITHMRLYIITVALLISINCFGQGDNLTIEQQRLSFIKGKWTTDGSELIYIEICDWIQGNHLQCVSTSNGNKAENSISYLSYSALEKVYIYYGLYGSGNSRTLRGRWIEDRFVFEGQRQTPDKLTKWRVTMKPNNGKIDFLEERSVDNGDWKESARFQYKLAPEQTK